MAIDNAEKRRSASGIRHPFGPGVTPNASKDVEWRQQVALGYSGILPLGSQPEIPVRLVGKIRIGIHIGL
jgi:hypothetical protein